MFTSKECNHVFRIRGNQYVCLKCGDVFKLGDFAEDKTTFQECASGRCGLV